MPPRPPDRRRFLAMSALGLATILTGCGTPRRVGASDDDVPPPAGGPQGSPTGTTTTDVAPTTVAASPTTTAPPAPASSTVALPPIPPPRPGPAQVVGLNVLPNDTRVALTIDDGYDPATSEAYVAWALATGIHITFSPNGQYDSIWRPLAARLAPAIRAGQVQIANHTFSHPWLTRISPAAVGDELRRNEAWIEDVFGITGRPWFRPPYGAHSGRVDEVAGSLGFTKVVMWDGSLGDSVVLTPQVLMIQASLYLKGGRVVLGHANHPTVTTVFDQLMALIQQRGLHPMTLDEMFGTSRATG